MTTTLPATPSAPSRPILARFDWGLIFTLLLCGFALWPLLYRPGLPNGNDVLYHVYRAAEMDRAWANGVLLPRWAESFYTGYGAPVFHYYASLSYYLTSILIRLFSLSALDALRWLIVLCVFGSGAGVYWFAKPRAGSLGGIIAALCYVYSPYLLFTETYSRGAYPELAALALFPLVMWRFDCLLRYQRWWDMPLAALALGALILTHNLMGLVLTGLLVAWLTWGLLTHIRQGVRLYVLALLAAGLGIGLAAYFWIPVILEANAVHLGNLTAVAQLDYRNFFVPLNKLLALSPRMDAGAINGLQHQFNLGVPHWILALTGLIGLAVLWRRRKSLTADKPLNGQLATRNTKRATGNWPLEWLFFALAGGLCLLLMLPLAESVWGAVSPLAFLQFPWRFLGAVGFFLAILAGYNALWIKRLPSWAGSALAVSIPVWIIAFAMPLFYIPEWDHAEVDTSVGAYQQAEVQGLQRATTFSNEYLPSTVQVEPDATDSLLADYADGYPVNHLNPETLPEGVAADLLDNGPQHSLWQVNAPAPFTMEVLIYDWAGWTAEVDDQPVPITPSDPHGLITFPVPAGDHTVRVYLGATPARTLGVAITLLSAAGVIIVSLWMHRHPSTVAPRTSHLAPETWNWQPAAAFVFTFAVVLLYMREGTGWINSPLGQALAAEHQTVYHLGDDIQLLGYDLNGESFRPGDTLELRVYWHTTAPIPYGYASFVHISTGGPPLAQADKQNPAGRPTKEWTSDGYIRDDYSIPLPADMPPGEYQVIVGLYTCDTLPPGECGNGERLPVTDAAGNPLGDALSLQTITVR
jgi:hypothetical protein